MIKRPNIPDQEEKGTSVLERPESDGLERNERVWCRCDGGLFVYGITMRGEYHRRGGTPCQDCSAVRLVKAGEKELLFLAVADGVGSCVQSHLGSATAVEVLAEHCAQGLSGEREPEGAAILELLRTGFDLAWQRIEKLADEMKQLPFSYFTTLTGAVYDGERLWLGHIGDDGAVILPREEGPMRLATTRHKGERANSVFPLQSGAENWQFLEVDGAINGFALATDGVLDSFVLPDACGGLVFEPFLSSFFYRTLERQADGVHALEELAEVLRSEEFLDRVGDDVTLLLVGNAAALKGRTPPAFDPEEWQNRLVEWQRARLAGEQVPPPEGLKEEVPAQAGGTSKARRRRADEGTWFARLFRPRRERSERGTGKRGKRDESDGKKR